MRRFWKLGLSAVVVVVSGCGEAGVGTVATVSTVADDVVPTMADVVETTTAAAPSTAPAASGSEVVASGDIDGVQPADVAASCAFDYNEATLAERSWAFDGTLVTISTGNDTRLDAVPIATFTVNRWFRGGTGEEVTVQYEAGQLLEFAPTVEMGTRMLVTGEPRWGGQPLDDAVAWGCGFTQPWTSTAAQQWSTVFGADT